MTEATPPVRSVVVERDLPHSPARVWRALTQAELMGDWLMETDFKPEVDRPFRFVADWGAVEGRVLEVEPERVLAYTWDALGLESVVRWTLAPSRIGTSLRMEQSGFRPDQSRAHAGASVGWARFLDALTSLLDRTA